jgi:hypothetical protein
LFTLSMTFGTPYTTAVIVPLLAGVGLEIAWFCSVRPAVVALAPYGINYFLPAPSYPESSSKKHKIFRENSDIAMIFPSVYVAHTGCFDKAGFPICVQSAAPLQQQRWLQVLRAVSARAGAPGLARRAGAGSAPQGPLPGRGRRGRRQLVGGGQTEAGDWSAYRTRTKTLELGAAGLAGAAPVRGGCHAGISPRPGGGGLPAPRRLLPRAAPGAPVGVVRPAGGCGCDRAPSAARPEGG